MPRVIGIDIPGNKRLEVALTYIYGSDGQLSNQIIEKLGLDKDMRAQNLTEDDIAKINAVLQSRLCRRGRFATADSK